MKTNDALSKPQLPLHRQWHEAEERVREGTIGTSAAAQWPWHYNALLSLRSRLLQDRDEQALEASEMLEDHAAASAETGTNAFDRDMSFALLAHEEDTLREIDAALTRIATGTYGICAESGEPIPGARLRAIPWTRYTKDVAERLEQQEESFRPHLGALRFVSDLAPAEPSVVEENDELALKPTGEGRLRNAGTSEDINDLTEEDVLTCEEREART